MSARTRIAIVVGLIALFAVAALVVRTAFSPSPVVDRQRQPASPLEAMIGQMIIVGFNGTEPHDKGVQAVAGQIAENKVGGVLLLGRNLRDAKQVKGLTEFLKDQPASRMPLIAIDQEGGRVQRLRHIDGLELWSSASDVAQASKRFGEGYAFEYYSSRARDLRSLGINFNLGPVVDLNINPENPIIGKLDRSYSDDPKVVAGVSAEFVRAHRMAGVLTALKHFPGHGSSLADSHLTLPNISASWDRVELQPYIELAKAGMIDAVMTGHLVHGGYSDGPDLPVSLSRRGIEALRALMGDSPIVITDDLHMRAISDHRSEEEAAVKAVLAGNDLLIFSSQERIDPDLGDRINLAIKTAVEDGRIPVETIARAYLRIIGFKRSI